jgi:hypothetical protein
MPKSVGMVCLAIVAFTIAVGCAVAQAGEAYDAKGRLMGRGTFHSDGSHTYSSTDGRFSFHGFRRGNVVQTYDTNGRLAGFGTSEAILWSLTTAAVALRVAWSTTAATAPGDCTTDADATSVPVHDNRETGSIRAVPLTDASRTSRSGDHVRR